MQFTEVGRDDISRKMSMWNSIPELISNGLTSELLEKFKKLVMQINFLKDSPEHEEMQGILDMEFIKIVSEEESSRKSSIYKIEFLTRNLLLNEIINSYQFQNLGLGDLINLLDKMKFLSKEIAEKFKRHPAIQTMTIATFNNHFEKALRQGNCNFAQLWCVFKPRSDSYFLQLERNLHINYLYHAILSCKFEMVKQTLDYFFPKLDLDHWLRVFDDIERGLRKLASVKRRTVAYDVLVKEAFTQKSIEVAALLCFFERSAFYGHSEAPLLTLIKEMIDSRNYKAVNELSCFSSHRIKDHAPYHYYAQFRIEENVKEAVKDRFSCLLSTGQTEKIKEMITYFPNCAEILCGAAAAYGSPSDLIFCIEELKVNPNNYPEDEMPPILYAIKEGKFENVKFLVEKYSVNLNFKIETRKIYKLLSRPISEFVTPLSVAVTNENFQVTEYLIQHGVTICDESFFSAIVTKKLRMVELLMQNGAKLNKTLASCQKFGSVVLGEPYVKILQLLFKKGATTSLDLPFIAAYMNGKISLLKYLSQNFKPDLSEEEKYALLKNVILIGDLEILKYLSDKYQIDVKNMLIKDLKSNKPMWGSAWQMMNLFTSLFENENQSLALLTYLFVELQAYPSLEQLEFHVSNAGGRYLYRKSYLLSLTTKEKQQKKFYTMIAETKIEQINNIELKNIGVSKKVDFYFLYLIRKTMKDRVACDYLIRTFNFFPKEITTRIASYAELAYPFF